MPSRPPETEFYKNDDNATLWRDISRLFEDFCADDPNQWPDRERRFDIVLGDVQVRLRDSFFRDEPA